MKFIDNLIYRIWNTNERSEIYDVLNEVMDIMLGKTNYGISHGNVSNIITNAITAIQKNYSNTYSLPEVRLILQFFSSHLNTHQFSGLCLFLLRNQKCTTSDIVDIIHYIEFYPEIRDDSENIILFEIEKKLENFNSVQLSKIVPLLRSRKTQQSYWNAVNYASLPSDIKEYLRDFKVWYYISPDIVYDIYRHHFNGNKRCHKEIKLQILDLISIQEQIEIVEMPCGEWVRSLCNSLLEDQLETSEVLKINRYVSSFHLSSADFEIKINQALFKSIKKYEDLIVLNSAGYFVFIENSLKDLAQKYKKGLGWLLETENFLGLITEHDERFIIGLRESTHGVLYIRYRNERAAENFFQRVQSWLK